VNESRYQGTVGAVCSGVGLVCGRVGVIDGVDALAPQVLDELAQFVQFVLLVKPSE